MDRFAGLVLKASQTLGAPLYVAAHLGVEPYDIYRWIAGSILEGKLERKPQAASRPRIHARAEMAGSPGVSTLRVDRDRDRLP
jgi:hypothetical protein